MAASVNSPEDVINLSLARIGFKMRVTNIFNGTPAAVKSLDIYAQTRDAVLRMNDWDFAEKITAAVVSGQSAPLPWSIEYTYPTDCIKLRAMFNSVYLADKNNPLPVLYTRGNHSPAGDVIWTNTAAATLVYTAQITDPAQWEPLFVETMAAELGRRLVVGFKGLEELKPMTDDAVTSIQTAESVIE